MSEYTITSIGSSGKLRVSRADDDKLKFDIAGKSVILFTEDLAALIRTELPKDRAKDLFAAIEEENVSRGKVKVVVKAQKDIKSGDDVCFTFDVTRYMDKVNKGFTGLRTTKSGIIY